MSIPPDSLWRGCAAGFPQPVQEEEEQEAERLVTTVHYLNCVVPRPPLVDPTMARIMYRSSDRERDVVRSVFRWDNTPFEQVFTNGFRVRRQGETPELIYYDLEQYVHGSGRPLDSRRTTTHVFVSTTLNRHWTPNPRLNPGEETQLYRYEIYAPGGIWVAQTLGNQYRYRAQDEVCFVAGIAPQYIRSAQLFVARREAGSRSTVRRANNILTYNRNFDPQTHPPRNLHIERPVVDYEDEDGTIKRLTINDYPPRSPQLESDGRREKRQVSDDDTTDWYTNGVTDIDGYIDAAFRSSRTNEAYLFMKNEYVRVDYAPGTNDDKILNRDEKPLLICDMFPSLIGTAFGEYGIDCAFDSDCGDNEAFIFSGNLCACIDYAPGTTDDKILKGPMTIIDMFPFFKGTVFANGIDAAFTSSVTNEAYLFKGDQYARINYDSKKLVQSIRAITEGFHSLRDTIFASGIDAAFASHRTDEAYLFKGDQYARINFAPGTTNDSIMGGVKPIAPNWPSSLGKILPRKNRGLDNHDHCNHEQADRDSDHDEL